MRWCYIGLHRMWRYLKCVIILHKEIGNRTKKTFGKFGKDSTIICPFLQLSGCSRISIGQGVTILDNCRLAVFEEGDSFSIEIGDRTYISYGFTALSGGIAYIRIGKDILFASNVLVTNQNHGIDPESNIPYMSQELISKNVEIGDGCWIGEKVCILPGVNIGRQAIIGAGAVVTKSIPAYSIAVGNPAKVIKRYNFVNHCWERV